MSHGPAIAAFAHLPAAFRVLLPEIEWLPWYEETRAACSRCVMLAPVAGEPEDSPWVFHADGRCCTYHPYLPSFAVGGALIEGGEAARVVRERMRGDGVTAWGIRPTEAWVARYDDVSEDGFGRDLSLQCPYWVGGDHACGIWRHRPATCRTWFCKHDHGLGGAVLWTQLKRVLGRIEYRLARFCIERGRPPGEGASVEDWEAWFRWCAERVAGATRDELGPLADDALRNARSDLVVLSRRTARVLPDVVVPSVAGMWPDPRGVRLSGYSSFDTLVVPRAVFPFLARLDGVCTWRDARDQAAAESGERLGDELVHELYRIGAIDAPGAGDATVLDRRPWTGLPGA